MHRLPPPHKIREAVATAIDEDLWSGDATTAALVHDNRQINAVIESGEEGVMCGGPVARAVFEAIGQDVRVHLPVPEGAQIESGTIVADLQGSAATILSGERTALNFLQRLCGVATLTSQYVAAVDGTTAEIADTRKTLPGMRLLDKYAVRVGGGRNHRIHAGDGILIKDNHLEVLSSDGLNLEDAIRRARDSGSHTLRIEVEVEDLTQLQLALDAGADVIMLDNMDLDQISDAVKRTAGRAVLEASGGINLGTVRQVAETGVDLISVGAITHSAPALDMSLRVL